MQQLSVLVAGTPADTAAVVDAIRHGGSVVRAAEPVRPQAARSLVGPGVDVVVVVRGADGEASLHLVGALTHEASCPVVIALPEMDADWVEGAVAAGAYGAVIGCDPDSLHVSLLAACGRFADYRALHEAFSRRAQIEQAKGLLMARHCVGGEQAFAMLREHSQKTNRKVIDIAEALVKAHVVLAPVPDAAVDDALRAPSRAAGLNPAEPRPA